METNYWERNWAAFCHLSSALGIVLNFVPLFFSIPIPLMLNILFPLLIWLTKRGKYPLVKEHGKECLNFQISWLIYTVIASIIYGFLLGVTCGVALTGNSPNNTTLLNIGVGILIAGFVILLLMGIWAFVALIFAAVKAFQGQFFHYPWTIRFLL